jgi:hypothetical protein
MLSAEGQADEAPKSAFDALTISMLTPGSGPQRRYWNRDLTGRAPLLPGSKEPVN